jgi:hypothetical protein
MPSPAIASTSLMGEIFLPLGIYNLSAVAATPLVAFVPSAGNYQDNSGMLPKIDGKSLLNLYTVTIYLKDA